MRVFTKCVCLQMSVCVCVVCTHTLVLPREDHPIGYPMPNDLTEIIHTNSIKQIEMVLFIYLFGNTHL